MTSYSIRFLPEDKTVEVPEGTKISEAAIAAGVAIRLPCGGKGRCGKCMVVVHNDRCGERVLACQTQIDRDMTVTIPSKDQGKVVAATDHRKVRLDDLTPVSSGLGLALDIGTTTVAIDIVDMDRGIEVFNAADVNRQRDRGEDVLSRIQYSEDGGTEELRGMVLDSVNDLIRTYGSIESNNRIMSAYVAGNTAMTHLFLGIDPSPIRRPPYQPVVRKATITGAESGLRVNPSAEVICMPSVASYVGGDITSGIVYSGMDNEDDLALLIDVGTNGEIALGNREFMMVCSSSAGPAFEGGKMTSGMLAAPGAIDSVRITGGELTFTVIGNREPKGICGSGLIDLLAQMFLNGFVDRRGNLTDRANAVDGVFTVTDGVVITQDEIDDIIRTKAAIYSAARSLVGNLGMGFSDVSRIYIAGGFGNFIDLESAITIGLFPDIDRSRYVYLGNSSLAGAKHALLSKSFRDRIDTLFDRMTYLDLSSDKVFFDEYTSAQFLPHTDNSQFPSIPF